MNCPVLLEQMGRLDAYNDVDFIADLYQYLLEFDYEDVGFDPQARPPVTAAKQELIEQSKSDTYLFLKDSLESHEFFHEMGRKSQLAFADIKRFITASGCKSGRDQELVSMLVEFGLEQKRVSGGSRKWILPQKFRPNPQAASIPEVDKLDSDVDQDDDDIEDF